MNYYRLPSQKFELPSNLLISTPASSTNLKPSSLRHEKSSSLLRLPPIKSTKAILPAIKRNEPTTVFMDKYKSNENKIDMLKEQNEYTGSPIKRILLSNKNGIKENRSIDPHQKNLKEGNGFVLDFSSEIKTMKSPLLEKHSNYNLEQIKTPKSEQHRLPKMQGRRLDGISELRIGGIHTTMDEVQKQHNAMLTSLKQRENFQLFFNPAMLLNDQLLEKDDLPRFELSKCSSKKNGVIKAYSANTHQGLIRNYNEDRVAIILNIIKPPNKKIQEWPSCSFFAIYDGHGGSKCAEFLRDHLHHYVNIYLTTK
jgi:hypothetical protein